MNISFFINQLNDNAERVAVLVRGIADEQTCWKPDPDSWSILEVINHLYDEEREDFRVRLEILLNNPEKPWPPIDPEGWVVERKYNQKNFLVSLGKFLTERRASIDWLETLKDPDWDKVYSSPFGSMSAGDMLTSWVAHDQLHMRQLVELHRAFTASQAGSSKMDYAGKW
jgi:hypothetical protein